MFHKLVNNQTFFQIGELGLHSVPTLPYLISKNVGTGRPSQTASASVVSFVRAMPSLAACLDFFRSKYDRRLVF